VSLGMKERWRIPIILAQIEKNVPLSEADAKIWAAVSHNTKIQEEAVSATLKVNAAANAKKSPKTLPNTPTSRGPTPRHALASVVLAARAQTAYMDGTTTSECRNKAAAKEKALEKEKEKAARKLAKRSSKTKSKSKARKVTSRGSNNSSSFDDSDNEQDDALEESTTGLLGQFVAGLASLSASVKATVSGKHRNNKVYVEESDTEGMMTSRVSSRGSAKAFGDTLVEPFDPSEMGCHSGLLTSRLSQTFSGDCTPIYTMLGDNSAGAGCFSNDDADWQVSQLESADPSEITRAPRRHSRVSFLPPVEAVGDSDDDSMCTKAVSSSKVPVNSVVKPQREVKPVPNCSKPVVTLKCPNSNNQVRFNEVTGMYERQLTTSAACGNKQSRLPSFSQALGGVVRATANLRASLTFDGPQSIGEALCSWLSWQNNSSIGAC